ncbi:MAG: hypothetical protein ACPG8V_03690, partial [Alphaproteobacteria bacterium]
MKKQIKQNKLSKEQVKKSPYESDITINKDKLKRPYKANESVLLKKLASLKSNPIDDTLSQDTKDLTQEQI